MAIFFCNAHFPLPSSLVSTSTYHTVGQGLSFDGSLTQDGAGGLELAGNAFKITGQVSDIDDLKEVLPSPILHFRGKCNDSCSGMFR